MGGIVPYKYPDDVITVDKAVDQLNKEFPEFWEVSVFKEGKRAYMLFDEFGIWVGERIQERTAEAHKMVVKSFSFVNECLEKGNDEVVNIIEASFLEAVNDYLDDSVEVGKILHKAGVVFLEKWRNYLRGKF